MSRTACLFVLPVCVGSAWADEAKKVMIRFLGGAKKTPPEGLTVRDFLSRGDWTEDRKKTTAEAATDKAGNAVFALGPGRYYVDIASTKELPYLPLPVGYTGHPGLYDRAVRVGPDAEQAFDFNLADACQLVLRAVDADTGKGIPGLTFVTESETAEQWGIAIAGDNIGARGATGRRARTGVSPA